MDGIVGNVSQSHRGGTGSGIVQARAQFGRITIIGKSGDVKILPTNGLFPKFGQVLQGLYAQVAGGGVVIKSTLFPADLAARPSEVTNPTHNIWVTDTTLAADSAAKLAHPLATALLLTFSADGQLVIAGA
jgi:hypothetical protein